MLQLYRIYTYLFSQRLIQNCTEIQNFDDVMSNFSGLTHCKNGAAAMYVGKILVIIDQLDRWMHWPLGFKVHQ